jgi:hypothetical protein
MRKQEEEDGKGGMEERSRQNGGIVPKPHPLGKE